MYFTIIHDGGGVVTINFHSEVTAERAIHLLVIPVSDKECKIECHYNDSYSGAITDGVTKDLFGIISENIECKLMGEYDVLTWSTSAGTTIKSLCYNDRFQHLISDAFHCALYKEKTLFIPAATVVINFKKEPDESAKDDAGKYLLMASCGTIPNGGADAFVGRFASFEAIQTYFNKNSGLLNTKNGKIDFGWMGDKDEYSLQIVDSRNFKVIYHYRTGDDSSNLVISDLRLNCKDVGIYYVDQYTDNLSG